MHTEVLLTYTEAFTSHPPAPRTYSPRMCKTRPAAHLYLSMRTDPDASGHEVITPLLSQRCWHDGAGLLSLLGIERPYQGASSFGGLTGAMKTRCL
jgi:hypothetical protein